MPHPSFPKHLINQQRPEDESQESVFTQHSCLNIIFSISHFNFFSTRKLLNVLDTQTVLCSILNQFTSLRDTHLPRVQSIQALVDPLLYVEASLQLLPVVLHRNPGMSLRDATTALFAGVFFERCVCPLGCHLCCHLCCGLVGLVSRLFDAHGRERSWEATQLPPFFSPLFLLRCFCDLIKTELN